MIRVEVYAGVRDQVKGVVQARAGFGVRYQVEGMVRRVRRVIILRRLGT